MTAPNFGQVSAEASTIRQRVKDPDLSRGDRETLLVRLAALEEIIQAERRANRPAHGMALLIMSALRMTPSFDAEMQTYDAVLDIDNLDGLVVRMPNGDRFQITVIQES